MGTVLGNLWHLLNPMLSIAVYALIFGVILKIDRGVSNFVAFISIGVFVFTFTQKAVTTGSQSIIKNRSLIRSVSFPRALLPITGVVTELLAFLPSLCVMFLTCLLTGADPRLTWLVIPLLVSVQFFLTVGGALIAARATSRFGDVKNILPFLFRLLFYGSGVLFSVDAYITDDKIRALFIVNPIFDLLEIYRWSIIGGNISLQEVLSLAIWTIFLPSIGLIWFRRGEATYGH